MRVFHLTRTFLSLGLAAGALACGDDEPAVTPDAGMSTPDMGAPDMGPPDMGEPECRVNADCEGDNPVCGAAGMCEPAPRAGNLGWGDETATSVDLTLIHASVRADQATDLAFAANATNQLWVLHRETPNDRPCNSPPVGDTSGCADLQGSTTTLFDVGTPDQRDEWIQDFNAWHFMRRPPAMAWGEGAFFATCGEARTGNFLDDTRADFIGPSLWTSDPTIYRNWSRADQPAGWNGTHMDMLHASPDCMGIAHETGNAYWVANGQIGSLDRYDFNLDHGPGQADHSDGEIHRYAVGTLTRVAFTPGHLVFHEGKVYAADTGGSRVIEFDPMGASRSGRLDPQYEPLADAATFTGGTVREVVPNNGTLQQPSGLEIRDGLLYVTDAATSNFHAFDLADGTLVRSLDTGLPAGSLAGFDFDADGRVYFVDMPNSTVYRIDPK